MKRLIKVAKELNVGIHTIVEHLNRLGFEIDEKPTAKVTDEMYNELLNKYQKSIAIKEKADRLIIGTRPTSSKEAPYGSSHVSEPKKETPPPPIFKKEAVKPTVEAQMGKALSVLREELGPYLPVVILIWFENLMR